MERYEGDTQGERVEEGGQRGERGRERSKRSLPHLGCMQQLLMYLLFSV